MAGDYNINYGSDFSGGIIPQDFSYAYNSDFAGGYVPAVIIPPPPIQAYPSEYITVPRILTTMRVPPEYRTIKIQPEGW